jgi:hypothetical protein
LTKYETISFLKGLSVVWLKDEKIFSVVVCIRISIKTFDWFRSYKHTDIIM